MLQLLVLNANCSQFRKVVDAQKRKFGAEILLNLRSLKSFKKNTNHI
jgi:hypothetical protein